ncbi:MAG: hypothetical protein LIP77_07200 [Planctomycetes bacterium]|nr:hypothetical protein [Planctomycetota bacterium]
MTQPRSTVFGLALLILVAVVPRSVAAGERAFSWSQAPSRGDYVGADLSLYTLGKYLAECQVNRPEIVSEVQATLRDGKYYRKSTKDQKGKGTVLTVSIDPSYQLRIVTWRNETCPTCDGSGKRKAPFDKVTRNINVNFKCATCDGKGQLDNHTTERYFLLSPEDFSNPELGRTIMREAAYSHAPRDAEAWVERLVSKNPGERLEACLWLDANYVREGMEFQKIMPMLKKARYQEANPKKKVMVWQFWAGKDIPGEQNRAFYRIYANSKTGKITGKGFYAAQ